MIDLSKIKNANSSSEIKNPKDLFMSLQRETKFPYLWDVQSEILSKWFERRSAKDIIIKMNTGSGKTVVALLILKTLMNENHGNSVYVVPDNYLLQQVLETAKQIGIKATSSEVDSDFLSNKAILVINISKLVNGKSAFGMRTSNNIPIENIIFDDAHASLSSIKDQYSVKISSQEPAYSKFFNLFKTQLASYKKITENHLNNLLGQFSGENIIVPFWIWNEKIKSVKEIFNSLCYSNNDDEIPKYCKFNYPLIEDNLELCRCFFNSEFLEIIPMSIAIEKIKSFQNAKHRIFLSATLPDLTVFCSILNISEKEIKQSLITPEKAYDIGERLVVFPQYLNYKLSDDSIVEKIINLPNNINTLIIVPSVSRSRYWEKKLGNKDYQILEKDTIREGIDNIRSKKFTGITIIINKYDGIDLPNDECRLVVIDKLPNIKDSWDKYELSVLPNSQRISTELIQKIEQGMGRGIRSNTDYCAVILMGNSLVETIYLSKAKKYFSEATKSQIELSEKVWDLIDKNEDEIVSLLDLIYSRDNQWIEMSKNCVLNCNYSQDITINQIEITIREAYNFFRKNNIEKAISVFDEFLKRELDDNIKGYVKMLKAEMEYFINQAKAQETLKSAYSDNINVLKPIEGITYEKLKRLNSNQAIQIVNNLSNKGPNEIMIKINSLLDNLKFEKDTSTIFENSIKELGLFLGFNSQMPEKEFGDGGPDNLWALNNDKYFIIECKNETTCDSISKTDIGQLLSSIQWFKNKYNPTSNNYEAILIHNTNVANELANPDPNMKIIDAENLEKLKTKIREFFTAIVKGGLSNNVNEIYKLLTHHHLDSNSINSYLKSIKI